MLKWQHNNKFSTAFKKCKNWKSSQFCIFYSIQKVWKLINFANYTAFENFFRSVENLHMAHLNPSAHRASCGGFSLCGGIPPVNVCHDSAHLLHTSSAAGPAAASHVHGAAGHHSADGKRRISTCSGYSTATGKDPLPRPVSISFMFYNFWS